MPVSKNDDPRQGKGYFKPAQINFGSGITAEDQALAIINQVIALHAPNKKEPNKGNFQKIGIIYSANIAQTQKLNNKTDGQSRWPKQSIVAGANQADVMRAVNDLLQEQQYQHLKDVFQIIPITTCQYNPNLSTVSDQDIQKGLDAVKNFLDTGGAVIGWQNQNTVKTSDPYAVGNGVITLPSTQVDLIQNALKGYAQKFTGNQLEAEQNIQNDSVPRAPLNNTTNPSRSRQYNAPATGNTSLNKNFNASPVQRTASTDLSDTINSTLGKSSQNSEIPVVCKGNLKGCVKIAFDNQKDADAFYQTLQSQYGTKVSYHGGRDKYPMVDNNGNKLFIVRFENNQDTKNQIPVAALDFLNKKFPGEPDKVKDVIKQMGYRQPIYSKQNQFHEQPKPAKENPSPANPVANHHEPSAPEKPKPNAERRPGILERLATRPDTSDFVSAELDKILDENQVQLKEHLITLYSRFETDAHVCSPSDINNAYNNYGYLLNDKVKDYDLDSDQSKKLHDLLYNMAKDADKSNSIDFDRVRKQMEYKPAKVEEDTKPRMRTR